MELIQKIEGFIPYNEQERRDKTEILNQLKNQSDIFLRENRIAHMTASAWVTNIKRDKVLMIYHNIFDSWSWLGGHADGEEDMLKTAIREVREESGIKTVKPVFEDIFSLEILTVDGHENRGEYVGSHLHLNITYLLEADENDTLEIKPDENSGVKWFGLEEAVSASTEPWFQERIYKKLNDKLRLL